MEIDWTWTSPIFQTLKECFVDLVWVTTWVRVRTSKHERDTHSQKVHAPSGNSQTVSCWDELPLGGARIDCMSTHQRGYREEILYEPIFIPLGCWRQKCRNSVINRDLHLFSPTLQRHLGFLFRKINSPVKVHSLIEIPLPRNYLMLVMIRGQPGVKGLIPMATRLKKK